jgi:hypothetical protein
MNAVGRLAEDRLYRRARRPLLRRAALTLLPALLWAALWHSLLAGAAGPAQLPANSFTPVVLEVIQGIESATLTGYVGDLSGEWPIEVEGETVTLVTRYSLAEPYIRLTELYALEQFAELGLPVTCHSYLLEAMTRCNIMAEQRGALFPERIVILGAHVDSITTLRPERFYDAPGADDNASGSAAVLAAAGVLRDYALPFTLRYVLFTGEEQGLYGSQAYAADVAAAGDDVVAMVNLDMIGYNTGTHRIDVHIRRDAAGELDRPIADVFSRTLTTYEMGLIAEIVPSGINASDHAAFWDQGFPAVLIIEDRENFNPNYHRTSDLLANLNVDYMTTASQAAVATVMQLAGVVDFATQPALVSISQPITLWAISHLPDTLPVAYSWDLGNGVLLEGPVITPTLTLGHDYDLQGSWQVTMTVSYEGNVLHISKRLPVRSWDLHLPLVVRPM